MGIRLAAPGQQIGAPAEIFRSLAIARQPDDGVIFNRAADAHFHSLALLLQKLLQEERCAQLGVDQAEELESYAVVPAEIHRQCGSSAAANEAHGGVVP